MYFQSTLYFCVVATKGDTLAERRKKGYDQRGKGTRTPDRLALRINRSEIRLERRTCQISIIGKLTMQADNRSSSTYLSE